jgi:PAS domain S-box-containing protein
VAAERLAFVANALPALIAYVDRASRYVWVNEGYTRWFDRPADEIIGRHVSEVLGDEAWEGVRPHIECALAGEVIAFDNRVVVHGVRREVRASYVPHLDDDGRVLGLVVLVTDITETKAVEAALRRSERMLAQSQTTARVGSWEVTLDEGLQEVRGTSLWSSETYRILGCEPGTPASLALFYRCVHPDDRAPLQARLTQGLASAEPLETEYRIVRPDGHVRVIHVWLHLEREAGGKTTCVFGTCQDITEHRLAELEVLSAREQLQLVVDTTPAFIARFDRDRRLVWANKAYAARLGKRPDELVGSRLIDLIGEAAFRVVGPLYERVLAGESFRVDLEILYSSGPLFVEMVAEPTFDAAGAPDGCVSVQTDLTHRRRLENERELAVAELREADRHKDEFLAMASHELRNPLAAILHAVEILDRVGPDAEDVARSSRAVIARQTRHMRRLLDDLLDASRVSHGKIQLQKERVELRTLVLQAVEVSRPIIVEKRHALSVSLAPQPLALDADPARMVQVFANLIDNAAKYTDLGGHISVTSVVDGREAVVTVRDDGVGMTPELLARAFDLFVQETRSIERSQGGLGIGLTLVWTLVRMHGGSVRGLSEGLGRGSEFEVRLPLAPAVEPSDTSEAPRDETQARLRAC